MFIDELVEDLEFWLEACEEIISWTEETRLELVDEIGELLEMFVDELVELLVTLKIEGVTVFEKREESEFGKFGWILDPEGRKIELWQPPES